MMHFGVSECFGSYVKGETRNKRDAITCMYIVISKAKYNSF